MEKKFPQRGKLSPRAGAARFAAAGRASGPEEEQDAGEGNEHQGEGANLDPGRARIARVGEEVEEQAADEAGEGVLDAEPAGVVGGRQQEDKIGGHQGSVTPAKAEQVQKAEHQHRETLDAEAGVDRHGAPPAIPQVQVPTPGRPAELNARLDGLGRGEQFPGRRIARAFDGGRGIRVDMRRNGIHGDNVGRRGG